jgi:hypothetical protein
MRRIVCICSCLMLVVCFVFGIVRLRVLRFVGCLGLRVWLMLLGFWLWLLVCFCFCLCLRGVGEGFVYLVFAVLVGRVAQYG